MEQRRCAACRKLFHPRPQSPGQKFCAAAQCQRERKRRWQKARRAADPDYRDNDVQANRQWRRRHPDYWPAYRRQHPQSVILNREKQRERDRAKRNRSPGDVVAQPPWLCKGERNGLSAKCCFHNLGVSRWTSDAGCSLMRWSTSTR